MYEIQLKSKPSQFSQPLHTINKLTYLRYNKNLKKFITTFVYKISNLPLGVTLKSESEERLAISPTSLGIIVVAVETVVADDKLSDCDCKLRGVATVPAREGVGDILLHLAAGIWGAAGVKTFSPVTVSSIREVLGETEFLKLGLLLLEVQLPLPLISVKDLC